MNTCNLCDYKVVSNKVFEKHMQEKHSILETPVEPTVQPTEVNTEPTAEVKEEIKEVVETPKPLEEDSVLLKFSQRVELYTNGKPYISNENHEIRVTGSRCMEIAADLVRRAREAYGRGVLL